MSYNKNIFKIWDSTGVVSFKTEKYLGFKFQTMSDYYDALMEYYNIEKGGEGEEYQPLFQYIMNEMDMLMNDITPGVGFESKSLTPNFKIDSSADMDIIRNGMSGIHKYYFVHGNDPSYECPDMEEYNDNEEDCFIFEVVLPTFHNAEREIRKKFGLRFGSVESNFIGEEKTPINEEESSNTKEVDFGVSNYNLTTEYKNQVTVFELKGNCTKFGITAYSGRFNLTNIRLNNNNTLFGETKAGIKFTVTADNVNKIINGVKNGQPTIGVVVSGEVNGMSGKCYCNLSRANRYSK